MRPWRLALALALVTGLAGGACTLFDDPPPKNTCKTDRDCFRAQGEVCNLETHACEPGDAGVDAL